MVWAGISISGRNDLHIIRHSNLTVYMYAEDILIHHVVPYVVTVGAIFLLMQNNTKLCTVLLMENLIEAEEMQRMEVSSTVC
ncbi:hypothetical protein TNCV_1154311 [Trichonephila clavipes]|nr:hypothetical protein TNCV_1154311 [Trichonephila clavipes]